MTHLFEGIFRMLGRHRDALKEYAFHEVGGRVFKLNIQMGRLRTDVEQREFLEKHYADTLAILTELDNGTFGMFFHLSNLLPEETDFLKEVSETGHRMMDIFDKDGRLKLTDFTSIATAELNEIPKDSIAFDALEVYKTYAVHEALLEKIVAGLDELDENPVGEKLTFEQLQKSSGQEDIKEILSTMIQQAVQPLVKKEQQRIDKLYYNMHEAADYLNLKVQTLYTLKDRENIPYIKPAKHVLFLKSDLDEWRAKGGKQTVDNVKDGTLNRKRTKTTKK